MTGKSRLDLPPHWKIIKRGLLYIGWQQGQHRVVCIEGKQPRNDGWKWTTGIKIMLMYDYRLNRWNAYHIQPDHPIVKLGSWQDTKVAIDIVKELMFEHNKHIKEYLED